MGLVFDNITIKNAGDVSGVRRGYIQEREIRQIQVQAMVDTGSEALIISEGIQEALGLDVVGEQPVKLANNNYQTCRFTEPIELHWRDRYTFLPAVVLSGITQVLLGVVPLEALNLMVDPVNHQLIGVNGDQMIFRV
ncbi:MAG: hypothetical protein LBG95_00675 [Treponema sp.]|jgi:clan AA aspartic protease|nr:hypothetical protein [Treponema sp.]